MADQASTTPTGTTPAPVVQVGPVIPPPTPLDPPVIVYNVKWRVPPLVIKTQEELDALDPTEWHQNPPPEAQPAEYPKLFFNVNVAPKIVGDADEAQALGDEWKEFSLPEPLVKAAQAKIDAASAPPTA